ncbi:MAG: Asp-tRNA(Asn)/Glu-tRNA(Gln) amidotransferase subunit GatB [Ruminococcaceae bacterium]|nr:Asp-tRNA(Asn)/Glu-tRNA(Gln) amidotransferase subunit GatB [Oscillospiraceae bacterium]
MKYKNYELTVGLETHIELSTKTKMFCSCEVGFAGEPNSRCCPVCLGLPGSLPVINRQAVEYAVMAGLALSCKINNSSYMDRKNYSYPDLPKAYQISQFDVPLCYDGFMTLSTGKVIRITRIHIEEDAGKLVHNKGETLVDYNRCGVPLIEIVTEPDFSSSEEVREYVEKLQHLMRYIGVSDCRMQEGSMRCDVNVSVKTAGCETLGVRTEIKNMNSVANMIRAIEYEYTRQSKVIEQGGMVTQETMRFDEAKGVTIPMRSKEDARDYRFFREPDLLCVHLDDKEIEDIKEKIPMLPSDKIKVYTEELGLSITDAQHLVKYRRISEYFDEVVRLSPCAIKASKFIIGQMFSLFSTEAEKEAFSVKVSPSQLAELVALFCEGKINSNLAKVTLDKMLLSGKGAMEFLSEEDMRGFTEEELYILCQKAIEQNPNVVSDYKGGKDKAIMALVGFVMRESKGKANADKAKETLKKLMTD